MVYSKLHKGYIYFDLSSSKFLTLRHVIFYDQKFPFRNQDDLASNVENPPPTTIFLPQMLPTTSAMAPSNTSLPIQNSSTTSPTPSQPQPSTSSPPNQTSTDTSISSPHPPTSHSHPPSQPTHQHLDTFTGISLFVDLSHSTNDSTTASNTDPMITRSKKRSLKPRVFFCIQSQR